MKFSFFVKQMIRYGVGLPALKYFSRWQLSMRPDASSVKDEQPWITFKAIDFLAMNINSASVIFEYGGGGSTLFFVKRASKVETVEHNQEWFSILSDVMNKRTINNWKGNLISGEKGDLFSPVDKANPEHYSSGDKASFGFNYKKYVTHIDQFPYGAFDLVSVDGRSRSSCIQHSISKVKQGGYLLVDNSDRDYYLIQNNVDLSKQFEVVLDGFGPTPYSEDFTKTTIWKKK